ncbi:MAG: type II secretion system protein GspN [Myxococcota bacterium]
MSDSNVSTNASAKTRGGPSQKGAGLRALSGLSKFGIALLALLLILLFIALLFPWDAVARRLEFEIGIASGSGVRISELAPALTPRGPVLRARDVIVEHPAVDRVQITALEVAPRPSRSWLSGNPALRIWADTELGLADGVLELGEAPAYVGSVSGVELSKLPLRLEATGLDLSGELAADANVALDPGGTLSGRVEFNSPSLVIQGGQLPIGIPFTRAEGVLEILESGATRIETVEFEGPIASGQLSGEIELVHHSQSPPVDLKVDLTVADAMLRQLAPTAGIPLGPDGKASFQIRGTLDAPEITPSGRPNARAGRRR